MAAHAWRDGDAVRAALLAAGAWCLGASGLYLLNDLADLRADRAHPRKRARPLASGALPISWGVIAAAVLLSAGIALAYLAAPGAGAGWALCAYAALCIAYSARLKTWAFVDLLALAGLFTLRVVGGALAIGRVPTVWLLAFTVFLVLGLAAIKRCAELLALPPGDVGPERRGYRAGDLPVLLAFGMAAGFQAVTVLALYLQSTPARDQYAHPEWLWALVPLLLLGQARLWLATWRGQMLDDPIVYCARDPGGWALVALALITVLAAAGMR